MAPSGAKLSETAPPMAAGCQRRTDRRAAGPSPMHRRISSTAATARQTSANAPRCSMTQWDEGGGGDGGVETLARRVRQRWCKYWKAGDHGREAGGGVCTRGAAVELHHAWNRSRLRDRRAGLP